MGIIKVVSASKEFKSKYDSKVVLSDFHMNVKKGAIYALMGASGCGKTTLISCIVGMSPLDSGTIELFDDDVGKNNSKVGYMPQDIALVKEFTIKEIIHFYGIIFGMGPKKIAKRLRFLSELLELPDDDQFVGNCSGGQQRRISFAIAMVHEPELLILDEPTVGVDPILRNKIWGHLAEITWRKNVTVLMTTHYIEEARQSTHVGLMRNGVLLAEATPYNLMQKFETTSLEEAFLRLSEDQEKGIKSQLFIENPDTIDRHSTNRSSNNSSVKLEFFSPSKARNILALTMKNVIQLTRNPGILVFALLFPLISIFCLQNTVGGNPQGLMLGIINNEVNSEAVCSNRSLKTFELNESVCLLNKISCRFIKEINDSIAIKKFYTNREDAELDARKGILVGFIYFAHNFSDEFPVLHGYQDFPDNDNGMIEVHLDNTDLQTVTFLQRNLYYGYHKFVVSLMRDCEKSLKVGSMPMVFETFNGGLHDEFKRALVPGILIATFFAVSSYLSTMALIEDRRSGIWLRTLTAGATPCQFLISHLIVNSVLMVFQAIEFLIYAIYVGHNSNNWKFILVVSMLLLLLGFTATLYGLCISVITDSSLVATYFSILLTFPFTCLSGVFWPLEGTIPIFRYIGYLLPFTMPSKSFTNILFSDIKLTNPSIYLGYCVLIGWVLIEGIICFWLSSNDQKKKK